MEGIKFSKNTQTLNVSAENPDALKVYLGWINIMCDYDIAEIIVCVQMT